MDIQSFKEKIRKRYSSRFIDYITSDTERLLKRGEKIKKSLRWRIWFQLIKRS